MKLSSYNNSNKRKLVSEEKCRAKVFQFNDSHSMSKNNIIKPANFD